MIDINTLSTNPRRIWCHIQIFVLAIFLTILQPASSVAQVGTLFNYTRNLSSSYVNHVYQDRQGFIWVSTQNGLNRYDGYSFYTYTTNEGLPIDNIICVIQDKNNLIYVGTTSGLYVKIGGKFRAVVDQATGKELTSYIKCLCFAPDGNIVFSTSGRGIWELVSVDEARVIVSGSGEAQYVNEILFDHKGILWASADKYGFLSYKQTGKGNNKKYTLVGKYPAGENSRYSSMCIDKSDNLYIGYLKGGIYVMNSSRKEPKLIPSTANITVSALKERADGNIYIGTNGNGVKVLNPRTGEVRAGRIASTQLDVSRTKICSILTDRNDNLWLGMFQKGVFMQSPTASPFHCLGVNQPSENQIGEQCIMAVYRQSNGTLWIACDQDGLYALDSNYQLIRHYAPSSIGGERKADEIPSTVLTIAEDNAGRLWVGSYTDGCGWIDPNTGKYHRASFSYGNAQSVFDINIDYLGRLWIGTLGDGVKCYDIENDKLTEYKSQHGKTDCLTNNYILEMQMSLDKKKIYVGTSNGLSCYDIAARSWTNTFNTNKILDRESITAIYQTTNDEIWIGTAVGMYNFNLKTRTLRKYGTKEGLPDCHVAAIESDNHGMLWISTSNGLCRFNPRDGKTKNFFVSDGLQGNEYSSGVSFHDPSTDLLFFGGTLGVSYFYPPKTIREPAKLQVTLTGLFRGNERIMSYMKSGSYVICEGSVSASNTFDFSHEDNTLAFTFSTLTYSDIEHIRFAYSINGDKEVVLPAGENRIALSRMTPGDYEFRVVAINNGVRSQEKTFKVTIHNPWYFTPVARIFYFLLFLAALWGYIHLQRLRNRERLIIQEHIHKEELNEQKLRFFINISHEIRTPMTLIVTPLLQLIREDNDPHHQSVYEIMKRNAERILHLVNQILDLRKIDKGQMIMQMRETDLIYFTDDLLKIFQPQATSKKINLEFIHEADKLPVWIDRSHFDKILLNLMSNAMKYTPVGGTVRITISSDDKEVKIVVFDNGEQIPEQSLSRIFERFYQATSLTNQTKTGTGVGLDLTRSLVLLHHGSIIARNVEDGVEFVVTIPLGCEHLSKDELALHEEEKKEDMSSILEQELVSSAEAECIETEEDNKQVKIASSNSKRPTVVVVEDDDEIRNYLIAELDSTYRVISFNNGLEALPNILREIPSLVISDVMMPQMDGNTLCAKIKSNVNTNHVPVILLTAKTRDEDRLESLETGADLYFTKPFNMDIVRRSIANLISSRRLMENKFAGKQDHSDQIDDIEIESADDKLLNRILAVVNANLSNSDLNIDMICTEVGISRVHLHRKMKELTNQTPHDFIRNLRLKQAARLLSRKGQNITEVMYRCGFNSTTSFSTMFKKMYGLSPREYMKEHAE